MPGGSTFTAIKRLPRAAAHVSSIEFHWGDLPASSKISLWTQQGKVALNPSDAGAGLLASFTLPALGVKFRSTNYEYPCKQIPANHRYIAMRYDGSVTSTVAAAVITLSS